MVAGAKRGLSGSGGLCPFLWERPSADQVNNTVSVPLVLDVNRYFKPVWKPGHLLDNNLKSCGNCLRPTTQIFLRAKPTRAFMNNQEPDLNPTPAETDSAKTNESVQRESRASGGSAVFISQKSPNCVEKVQPSRWGP